MYQIKSYTADGKTFNSMIFDSTWATNMIAISYMRNSEELVKAEIINLKTKEIEKTYIRG